MESQSEPMTGGMTDDDHEILAVMRHLRDSLDELDAHVRLIVETGATELSDDGRRALRTHRRAWKRFNQIRKERWPHEGNRSDASVPDNSPFI
ncbi:MAG: hypothetical protein WKF43_07680 [Acidimicrobiales bacterium]